MCSGKKKLFHKLVKSLNFASKKYNLRKTKGLKLYWNGIFFFFKNPAAIKKILQSLRCGVHHQKQIEQRISYLWTKIVLFSYIESLQFKTLKETL